MFQKNDSEGAPVLCGVPSQEYVGGQIVARGIHILRGVIHGMSDGVFSLLPEFYILFVSIPP